MIVPSVVICDQPEPSLTDDGEWELERSWKSRSPLSYRMETGILVVRGVRNGVFRAESNLS